MHGLRAKLEAISTQCCAFAQPHWHSQESLLQPCSVQTKFWPMDVRVALNCTKGSSLLLLVWGWMESHCIRSRFQPAAEVDTCHNFWQGMIPVGVGQLVSLACPIVIPLATVPCLLCSRSIIHSTYMDVSQLVPEGSASSFSPPLQLFCTDPLIPFPRAPLSCLLFYGFSLQELQVRHCSEW